MPLSGSGGSKSISSSDSTKIDWEEFFSEGNEPAATDDLIKKAEEAVGGYKLPDAYVKLLKIKNGGVPKRTCVIPKGKTVDDVLEMDNLYGVGGNEAGIGDESIDTCGENWYDEWEYPRDIGVIMADTPSAGTFLKILSSATRVLYRHLC